MPPSKQEPSIHYKLPSTQLVQVITADKLSGFLGRWLNIPKGYVGLVIQNEQLKKIVSPGRRVIVSWIQQLVGTISATQVMLLKTEPTSETIALNHLLTATNDEPVDILARITFRIKNP
ncbi:MAG: hypothetical protein AAF485_21810, partial [Chloroflexota bacterium]